MSSLHQNITDKPFTETSSGNRAYFSRWKGIGVIETEFCPDHIHMLTEIPPEFSASPVMDYLKGKSSSAIYERWGKCTSRIHADTTEKILKKNYKAYPKSTEKNAGQSQLTTDFYPFTVNQAIFALSDHHTPLRHLPAHQVYTRIRRTTGRDAALFQRLCVMP